MTAFGDRLSNTWGIVWSRTGRIPVGVCMMLRLRARELLEEMMDAVWSGIEDKED